MNSARGSILLVDDEEKILKRLGRALRDEGHEVIEAPSARDAQRHLSQRAFDLVVVDNVMHGMTGLELLREMVSSIGEAERPQVVMMTAHGSTQIVREAFKLGSSHCTRRCCAGSSTSASKRPPPSSAPPFPPRSSAALSSPAT
jgi:DNA-binding NtrC family response regulator